MLKVIVFLFLALIVISRYSVADKNQVSHRLQFDIGILDECVDFAKPHFQEMKNRMDVEYSFHSLALVPDSHTGLNTYVRLSSNTLARFELVKAVNNFMVLCNPSTSITTDLPPAVKKFVDQYRADIRSRGAKGKIYQRIENGYMKFFFQNLKDT